MTEYGLCVIVSGTLDTGFRVIGPFKHPAHAAEWADAWEEDITWEVLPVVEPTTLETPPADQWSANEIEELKNLRARALTPNKLSTKE